MRYSSIPPTPSLNRKAFHGQETCTHGSRGPAEQIDRTSANPYLFRAWPCQPKRRPGCEVLHRLRQHLHRRARQDAGLTSPHEDTPEQTATAASRARNSLELPSPITTFAQLFPLGNYFDARKPRYNALRITALVVSHFLNLLLTIENTWQAATLGMESKQPRPDPERRATASAATKECINCRLTTRNKICQLLLG